MDLETQYKLRNNIQIYNFLKDNSHWYKYLNRNKNYYKIFEQEMKKKYKLTTKDRIEKVATSIEKVSKFIDILK